MGMCVLGEGTEAETAHSQIELSDTPIMYFFRDFFNSYHVREIAVLRKVYLKWTENRLE